MWPDHVHGSDGEDTSVGDDLFIQHKIVFTKHVAHVQVQLFSFCTIPFVFHGCTNTG